MKDHDIEDWSNDAKNSALHHMNILHFKIQSCENITMLKMLIFHFGFIFVKLMPQYNM